MKIFNSAQIRELDNYTIAHEPIESIELMERAAKAITYNIMQTWTNKTPFVVFAGPGNNGGDALAVARMLAMSDYVVSVYVFNIHNHLTEDCEKNKQRALDSKRLKDFHEVVVDFEPPKLTADMVVVDGLFGSGLNKPLSGGFASLVKYINQSPSKVVSIDLPSGLMAEDNTYNVWQNIIQADYTFTLQQLKLSMLLADSQPYLGEVRVLDIRLSPTYIQETIAQYQLLEEQDVRNRLRQRSPFAHKGDMGTALLIAGCYGMAGAAVLATRACLRSGVGKVIVHTPKRNYGIMQTSIPEAVLAGGGGVPRGSRGDAQVFEDCHHTDARIQLRLSCKCERGLFVRSLCLRNRRRACGCSRLSGSTDRPLLSGLYAERDYQRRGLRPDTL